MAFSDFVEIRPNAWANNGRKGQPAPPQCAFCHLGPIDDRLCEAGKLYAYRPGGRPWAPPSKVASRGGAPSRGRRKTLPSRYADCVIVLDSDQEDDGPDSAETANRGENEMCFHYFCVLFSSQMDQNGIAPDSQFLGDESIAQTHAGLFGFLIKDIMREIDRTRAFTCQFCTGSHANVECRAPGCWAHYHYTCGAEAMAQFVFHDDFPSYCPLHRLDFQRLVGPVQGTVSTDRTCLCCYGRVPLPPKKKMGGAVAKTSSLGVVSPCCGRTFHWLCVQKMAMAGGSSLFKCPNCLDNQLFVISMRKCGIYIPLQDVPLNGLTTLGNTGKSDPRNAIGATPVYDALPTVPRLHCDVPIRCRCKQGRNHNKKATIWELIACQDCSIQAIHVECGKLNRRKPDYTCDTCRENRQAEEQAKQNKLAEAARRKEALKGRKIGPKSKTIGASLTAVTIEPPLPKVTLSKQSGQWISEVKGKKSSKSPTITLETNQDLDPLDIGDFELVPTPSPRTSRSSRGRSRLKSPSPDILIVDPLSVMDPLSVEKPAKGRKRKASALVEAPISDPTPTKKGRSRVAAPSPSPDWAFPTPPSGRSSRSKPPPAKTGSISQDSSTPQRTSRSRRSTPGMNRRWSPSPSRSPPSSRSRGITRSGSNSSSLVDFTPDIESGTVSSEDEPLAKKIMGKKGKKAAAKPAKPAKPANGKDLPEITPVSTRRSSKIPNTKPPPSPTNATKKTAKPGPKSKRRPPSPLVSPPPAKMAKMTSRGGPKSRRKLTDSPSLSPILTLPKLPLMKPGPKRRKSGSPAPVVVPPSPKATIAKPGPKSRRSGVVVAETAAKTPAKVVETGKKAASKPGPKSKKKNHSVATPPPPPPPPPKKAAPGPKSKRLAASAAPKKAKAGPRGRRKAKSPSPILDDYEPSGGFDSPIGGASPVYSSEDDTPLTYIERDVSPSPPPPIGRASKPGPASSKKVVTNSQPLESMITIKQEFLGSPGPKSPVEQDLFDQIRESTPKIRLPPKKRPQSPIRLETKAVTIKQEPKYRPGPKSTLEKRSGFQPERQSIRVLDKPLPRRQAVKRTLSESMSKTQQQPLSKKARKGSTPQRIYQVKGKDIIGGIMSDLLTLMEDKISVCRTFSTQVATDWIHQDLLGSVFQESTHFCGQLLQDTTVDETLFRLFGPPYSFHLECERASQYLAPLEKAQLTLSDCFHHDSVPPREALNSICRDILVDVADAAKNQIDDHFRWALCSQVVTDLVEGVFEESAQFCAKLLNEEVVLETCFQLFGPPYQFNLNESRAEQYLKPLTGSILCLPDVLSARKLPRLAANTICFDILTDVAFEAKDRIDDRFRLNVCTDAVHHLIEDWLFQESSRFCSSILESVVDEAGYRLFGPPKTLPLGHDKAPLIVSKLQGARLMVPDCIQQKCIPTEATRIFCDEILFDVIAQAETDILNGPLYRHRLVSEVLTDILRAMPMKSRRSIEVARMAIVTTRCRGLISEVVDRAENEIVQTQTFPHRASYMILSELVDSMGPAIIAFRREKERLQRLEEERLEAERRRPKAFSIGLRDIYSLAVIPHPAVEFLCSGIMHEIVEQAEATIVSRPRFVERMASYTLVRMVNEMALPVLASRKRKRESSTSSSTSSKSSFSPSTSKRMAVSDGPQKSVWQNGMGTSSRRRYAALQSTNGLLL